MNDEVYRQKLIEEGRVPVTILDTVTSSQLNCIGNCIGVYRTSMQEQNPAAFAIEQERSRKFVLALYECIDGS